MFYKYFENCFHNCNTWLRLYFSKNNIDANNVEVFHANDQDQDQDTFEIIDQSSTLLNCNQKEQKFNNSTPIRILQQSNESKNKDNDYEYNKECIICLEIFNINNPLTLTLCSCGMNKTNFHLPCLLLWIEKNRNISCPVCRSDLYFEESNDYSNLNNV